LTRAGNKVYSSVYRAETAKLLVLQQTACLSQGQTQLRTMYDVLGFSGDCVGHSPEAIPAFQPESICQLINFIFSTVLAAISSSGVAGQLAQQY